MIFPTYGLCAKRKKKQNKKSAKKTIIIKKKVKKLDYVKKAQAEYLFRLNPKKAYVQHYTKQKTIKKRKTLINDKISNASITNMK